MHHLLAAGVTVLIFALGTATSIGTSRALQGWATSTFDASLVEAGAPLATNPVQQSQR